MLYRQNADGCFSPQIKNAIAKSAVDALVAKLAAAKEELKAGKNKGAAPLLAIASKTDDLAELEALGKNIVKQYKHLVIVGSGGSSLSGQTLQALRSPYTAPQVHFLDNMDPDAIGDLLDSGICEQAFFLIISKSGSTVETLGQFYVIAEKLGKQLAERALIITMPGDNPMRAAAKEQGIRVLDHASDIGGRFSIFTNVGLLPAAVMGLDIKALRKGASSVLDAMEQPMIGAALQYACMEKGYNNSVILPYGERLSGLARWYRQGWAESLGKNGKGTSASVAMGTTDQHSQLQLYLGGPRDKLITFVTAKRAGTGQTVRFPKREDLAYLQGKTTGDIMAAEQKGTLETLIRNGVPVRQLELEKINEETLGALLMHFTLEIIFMSYLLGVDPFDQPAVEEGKKLTREYLLSGKL